MEFKVVVWDFDGVIFDSMHLKCAGYKQLFGNVSTQAWQQFEQYHYKSGGISRNEKIDYFYRHILGTPLEAHQIDALVLEFGQIISKELFSKSHLNAEVLHFIQTHHKSYPFHVASAALHTELQALCAFLEITPYFQSIEGSPPAKPKVVAHLIEKYAYAPQDMVLIGDSSNDYLCARENQIAFLGYNNPELKTLVEGVDRAGYLESFQRFNLQDCAAYFADR
ncbi:HAD family hydrolase [Helicobacter salomonis]|uniref:HAD family hydrolase n=1 Tax=Helicobacter salomonis TaxID=56878 RepID=UPI000CF18763|nr:HAD hydrolase-like protein [Helicobacter salomonis]